MPTSKPTLYTKLSTIGITMIIVFAAMLLILLNNGTDTFQVIIKEFGYISTVLKTDSNKATTTPTSILPTEQLTPNSSLTHTDELPTLPSALTFTTTENEARQTMLQQLQKTETQTSLPTIQNNPINGFSTESWTTYNLTLTDEYFTHIKYEDAPDFAYVSKVIPLNYTNGQLTNAVSIQFENIDFSVSQIDFYLQGDQKLLLGVGDEAVKEYFRESIGQYTVGQDGVVNLVFDISQALKSLEGRMDNGVSLIMLIESNASLDPSVRSGELTIQHVSPLTLTYANNTIQPWVANGEYTLESTPQRTLVKYKDINHFDNLSTQVMNHQEICHYLNLELKNIDRSVENITLNVYGQNNQAAFIPVNLLKYKSESVSLNLNLLEYNNQIGSVERIELLIDSNPYLIQSNNTGSLEIISTSFTSIP